MMIITLEGTPFSLFFEDVHESEILGMFALLDNDKAADVGNVSALKVLATKISPFSTDIIVLKMAKVTGVRPCQ